MSEDWYDAHTHRTDFLGHIEPRRNGELHDHLRTESILTFPHQPRADVTEALDRALSQPGILK